MGFQAMRAQSDNAYLAKFLQNGLVGLVLYLVPFIFMLIYILRHRRLSFGIEKKHYTWVMAVWIGVLLAMLGLDLVPSFGNVINILLFVASASALVPQPESKVNQTLPVGNALLANPQVMPKCEFSRWSRITVPFTVSGAHSHVPPMVCLGPWCGRDTE